MLKKELRVDLVSIQPLVFLSYEGSPGHLPTPFTSSHGFGGDTVAIPAKSGLLSKERHDLSSSKASML